MQAELEEELVKEKEKLEQQLRNKWELKGQKKIDLLVTA